MVLNKINLCVKSAPKSLKKSFNYKNMKIVSIKRNIMCVPKKTVKNNISL